MDRQAQYVDALRTQASKERVDKVKKALKSKRVYDNFLRCLNLYSHDIVNKHELVELVSGFLSKFPELMAWFKNFVGCKDRRGDGDKGFGDATLEQLPMCEIPQTVTLAEGCYM